MNIKVQQVEYHRNGVSGEWFHAILFEHDGENFIGIVFDAPKYCAVICLDRMAAHGVDGFHNAWRGDRFEPALRQAIQASNKRGEVMVGGTDEK